MYCKRQTWPILFKQNDAKTILQKISSVSIVVLYTFGQFKDLVTTITVYLVYLTLLLHYF